MHDEKESNLGDRGIGGKERGKGRGYEDRGKDHQFGMRGGGKRKGKKTSR